MLNLLKTHFGFDQFLPLQEEIIRWVLAEKDALVLMPTGGGKSLCYQLPALMLPGLTLVISPLIALMKDQVDALQANGIPAEFINSTLSYAEIEQIQRQAQAGKIKILYVAPERLVVPEFQHFLQKINVSLIAIDESHCISEWGHDFRPDYRNLKTLRQIFPEVAGAGPDRHGHPKGAGGYHQPVVARSSEIFISSFNRPNLSYAVLPKKDSYDQLIQYIAANTGTKRRSFIVFRRKDTEHLAADLRQRGLQGAALSCRPGKRGAPD